MRILHTSDWHLGQHLMMNDRRREHEQFLDWLIRHLKSEAIDCLLVAGDIFDTGTPPNYALQLYYNFLRRIPETPCSQVVIIGGNHDSISTLHAPKELLKLLRIHVIGGINGNLDEEIIVAGDSDGQPGTVICAVPFLRDRDIRQPVAGESYEERGKALLDGIRNHYREVRDRALSIAEGLSADGRNVPIITTGHLYTAGGRSSEGVREIYVGSLGQVQASSFPPEFDYVALGHLHQPQAVEGSEHIRYSGSPIALSFSEAGTAKQVTVIDFHGPSKGREIVTIPVPEFQKLRCLKGNLGQIAEGMKSLDYPSNGDRVWVEVHLAPEVWVPDIQSTLSTMTEGLPVDILAIKSMDAPTARKLSRTEERETLKEFAPFDVFRRRLQAEGEIDEQTEADLVQAFKEILNSLAL
jgi:exonuclease SbcD